jgi:hypothetical protein
VAADVARSEVLEPSEPVRQTAPDQVVVQHRHQCRRERDGDATARAAVGAALEHSEEWEIALDERLDEPPLFERIFVLGMAHVRKVRVEHDREIARGTGSRHGVSSGGGAR